MRVYTILIADDKIENLQIIESALLETGIEHKLIMVVNGQILVDFAEKRMPDLIITDWEMPEMDGIEAIRELKRRETTKNIPVIMCTGIMTDSSHLETAFTAGAIDYIRHPIDKVELQARVTSMLKLSDSIRIITEQNTILLKQGDIIKEQQALIIEKETQEINNLLKLKQDELKTSNKRLINYDLCFSKIITDFKSLNPYVNKEGAKVLNAIISNYSIENKERICDEIEVHFKETHYEFYKKLECLFPSLTLSEKRICILLYLQMNTKQIADILCKSVRTIESIRTSIRKKMNIENTNKSLYEALLDIE